MKMRIAAVMMVVLLLTGCSRPAIANRVDTIEENVENAVVNMVNPTQEAITQEEAESIALQHAGFTADQVTGLRTEYEIDDGIPRFEVRFRQDRWEYDYEINAETGAILSFDKDD